MRDQRKKIILNEILYWKTNKILPDQYCDYLLALYNQGEAVQESQIKRKGSGSVLERKNSIGFFSGLLFIFTAITTVVVFHFTELSITLQTAILTIIVAGLILIGIKTSNKLMIQSFAYITAAFILLIFSIDLWGAFGRGNIPILYSLIGMHCLIWIIFGSYKKYIYFTVAGLLGLMVLGGSFLI